MHMFNGWKSHKFTFLLQMDYVGVIKPLFANGGGDVGVESNSLPAELPYSATSLVDHRITLQRGDAVSMQMY